MSMKRKSSALGTIDTPDGKRRKSTQASGAETPETTTKEGLEVVAHVKNAKDKQDNPIATHFLTLPDRRLVPDYYDVIALPIAIDTIEERLQRREYDNLSQVESDFKRMIANAKQYNERDSAIHSDAEKIRKNISNHMRKVNPAYSNPSYQAFPTPVPETPGATAKPERTISNNVTPVVDDKKKIALKLNGPRSSNRASSRAESTPVVADPDNTFTGLSYQKAQEKLIGELMDFTNNDEESVSGPFLDLPPRYMKEYYATIKQPLSLRKVQKNIRGVVGREPPTGSTLYKNWHALADEIHLIWDNAREYNEEKSDIWRLAGELGDLFQKLYAQAKAAVPDPAQPRINLKLGGRASDIEQPSIKLRLSAKAPSTDANGVMVDSAALKRQQELVAAGANGRTSAVPSASPAAESSQPNGITPARPETANGIGSSNHSGSPAPRITLARNGSYESSMPPPSGLTPRLHSGSPHPQALPIPVPAPPPPTSPLENRFRAPGKTAADALIQRVTISNHPMHQNTKFRLPIYPSEKLTQTSTTINVDALCNWIRIEPVFSPAVFQRQHNLFTMYNYATRLPALKVEMQDFRRPVHETRVMPGLNTIECVALIGPVRGAPKVTGHSDVEFEKVTVFVNVMS